MVGEGNQGGILDILTAAQLYPAEELAALGEVDDTFGCDALAAGKIDTLKAWAVACKHVKRGIGELDHVGEIDGDQLPGFAEHLDEGVVGNVDAAGEGESFEAGACAHAEEELVLELSGKDGKVETADKGCIGEDLVGLADDGNQLEEGRDLVEGRAVPEELDTTDAPCLADLETREEIWWGGNDVLEDVEEDLMWELIGW